MSKKAKNEMMNDYFEIKRGFKSKKLSTTGTMSITS
jgi:hypothetical protein